MSFFGIGQKIEKVIGKEQELLDSSRNGNVDAVEKLLANRSKKSTTGGALGQKLTSFLKNVNVNYTDKNGYTALHHAAVNGHRDVVEALLKADAQPGLVDNQGCTPVHLAAWNGNAEIVMQLLMAGSSSAESETSAACVQPVNVNHQNGNGDTALHCAAQYGHVPVVDVLLQRNGNPTIRNLNEESALDLAAQYGRLEVVQLLLISFPELSQRPACTQSPLHLASRNGHKDIVDVLLANNFAVQTVTDSGSALHEAALHGKLDVVKALLDCGIDINLCDKEGRTALQLLSAHQAQQKSFTEITQAIQDHMTKSDSNRADSEVYDRLSCFSSGNGDKPMATVRPLTPDKPAVTDKQPLIKTPEKLRSSSTRRSQYNPSPPPSVDTPPTPTYSKPNKDRLNDPDRVVSTTSSIGDVGPPPLPPRMSVYPQEDKGPDTPPGKDSDSPTREGSPGTTPKSMVVPKKPPRHKKSPVPVRHSTMTKTSPSPDSSPVSSRPPENIETAARPPENIETSVHPPTHIETSPESLKHLENIPKASTNVPENSTNTLSLSVNSTTSSQHSKLTMDQSEKNDNSTHNSVGQTDQPQKKDNSTHKSVGQTDQSQKKDDSTHNSVGQTDQSQKKDNSTHNSVGQTDQSQKKDNSTHNSVGQSDQSQKKDNSTHNSVGQTDQSQKKDNSTHNSVGQTDQSQKKVNSTHNSVGQTDQSQKKDNSTHNSVVQTDQTPKKDDLTLNSLGQTDLSGLSVNVTSPSEPKRSPTKPRISPKPSLPPRSSPVSVVKDNSIHPETGVQVSQTVYMEMKPKPKPRVSLDTGSETKSTETASNKLETGLKPADVKVDNYGILFPNLKNSSPIKNKPPKVARSNTAPEENVYIGPTSPAEKLKEKQGLLRRINTAPDDQTYEPMTGPAASTNHEPGNENEYAEIPEKTGAPVSPVENIYATIPEVKRDIDTKVNSPVLGPSSNHKVSEPGKNSELKSSNPATENVSTDQHDVPKLPSRNGTELKGGMKPTYLDFMKKQPSQPLTPTGYPQPPTPDFPPPSPATAMLGIEQKIQEMDCKRKSRDMTTLTDDFLEQLHEQNQQKGQGHSTDGKVAQSLFRSELNIPSDRLSREVIKEEGTSESAQVSTGTETSLSCTNRQEVDKVGESSVIQSDKTESILKSSIPDNSTVIEDNSLKMADTKMADSPSANQKPEEKSAVVQSKDEATADSPVMMRRKSSTSTPDMDVFKGLLRGSTIGGSRPKGLSLVYDEVQSQSSGGRSIASSYLTIDSLMEEDGINVDQVMKSIDKEVAKRASNHESGGFDDSEEWAQIQDIMASFGSGIARESVFIRDIEPAFTKLISGSMQSVGEWLESLGLGQYENTFIANGYDNVDFLDNKMLEEQDLEQISVFNHDHRRQILFAARSLPQLKPIDSTNPPASVEEWLMSLQLIEYLETFKSHGYDSMEKVESILWELQLRTVLDISQLGHRKRILASLGERHPPDRQTNSLKKKTATSTEATKQPFSDINLFRDYRNVKPTSSSEEDVKEITQMAVDSSEDEDLSIAKKKSGQSIRNSNIHLRPPHMAQTTSPARQWRHKPEMLIKGCCNYTAQYLGSTIVPDLTGGTESTREGITKLKRRFMQQLQKSTDMLAKIPVIMLSISFKGVKFIDAKSKKVICDHDIGNIFCACQDTENLNFFAYITRDIETAKHYCHVFSVKSSSLAHDIILTLGESFEVAYQMALKEKSMKEAMELDRKMSQSDHEDAYSQSSKISTNTL